MEYTLIDTQFKYGLPTDADSKGTISIYNTKEKKLNFHIFNKLKGHATDYDVSIYDPSAPIGFSLFMSKYEKMQIKNYLAKSNSTKTIDQEDQITLLNGNNKIDNPLLLPLPRKEHCYCHICHGSFKEYLEHLESKEHITNVKWHEKSFKHITNNFEKIRNFWEDQKRSIEIESHIEKLNLSNKSKKKSDVQVNLDGFDDENKENINIDNIYLAIEKDTLSKRKRKKSDYFKDIDLFKDVTSKKIKSTYNLRNKLLKSKEEINELVDRIGKTKNLLKDDLRLSIKLE